MEKLINLQRLGRFLEKVKSLIDEKYTKPTGGIPKADLADDAKITKANITSAMGGVVALKSQAVPNTGDSTIYGNKTFASGITLGDADLGGKIEPYIIVTSVDVMNSSDGQSTNYDLTGEYEYDCDGKKVYKATPFDEIWEDVPELWLRFNGTELDAVLIPDDMKFFVEDPRFDPDEGDFIVTGVTKDVDGDIIINNTHWSQVKSAANGAVRYDVSQSLQLSDTEKATARNNISVYSKAEVDAMTGGGVQGVISQTQTWNGNTYTMNNKVMGTIPQSFIDLWKGVGGTFDTTTKYFGYRGINDISYNEAIVCYTRRKIGYSSIANFAWGGLDDSGRCCMGAFGSSYGVNLNKMCYNAYGIERFNPSGFSVESGDIGYMFTNCTNLISVDCTLSSVTANTFVGCSKLTNIKIKNLGINISFSFTPYLTAESVAYMITKAGTATITITLHATAYARAMADSAVQSALASKTNVSLASA